MPKWPTEGQSVSEHSAQGIEYTTPFTSIIPGLTFTFVRDFLRVFLEVKTVCTPSGSACSADLHADALGRAQKGSQEQGS